MSGTVKTWVAEYDPKRPCRRFGKRSAVDGLQASAAHAEVLTIPQGAAIRIDNVGTAGQISPMTKSRITPSESSPSATPAVAARAAATDVKGSINLRIERGTRQLIDDAAAALGKTRTEFMVESARLHAVDVLLDQRLFTLDPERHDAFMRALDTPPAPGPKLEALLRRTPAWQK